MHLSWDCAGRTTAKRCGAPQAGGCPGCPELEREAETADRLRALLALFLEFVPADHPAAAKAFRELE